MLTVNLDGDGPMIVGVIGLGQTARVVIDHAAIIKHISLGPAYTTIVPGQNSYCVGQYQPLAIVLSIWFSGKHSNKEASKSMFPNIVSSEYSDWYGKAGK